METFENELCWIESGYCQMAVQSSAHSVKVSVIAPRSQLILQPFFRFSYERSWLSKLSVTSPRSQLILKPFCRFTYVTAHSPTFPSHRLRHNSFSNPSVALPTSHLFSNLSVTSPTSQLILQPIRRFNYVTAHSPTLPLLHLRHRSFSNPSFTSPTSLALHLRPLASRPCCDDGGVRMNVVVVISNSFCKHKYITVAFAQYSHKIEEVEWKA